VNVSRLSEKVALVTGASKGIGAGIATALAAAGARLVVNYSSDREGAEHIARAIIDSRGEAIAVGADISKAAEVAQLFKEVDSAFGRLDVLVNNAGAVLAGKTPLGRLGRVTDIAPLAVFLASDESTWITRKVIRAAGGLVVAT
jgi:NAD(P)-dependent dehydrogenase (short-subunit alcohol dehydrogenase family)